MKSDPSVSRRAAIGSLAVAGSTGLGLGWIRSRTQSDRRTDPQFDRSMAVFDRAGGDAFERYVRSEGLLVDRRETSIEQVPAGFDWPLDTTGAQPITCVEPDDDCELGMKVAMYLIRYPLVGWVGHIVTQYRYRLRLDLPGPVLDGPTPIPDAIAFSWHTSSWDVATPEQPESSMGEPVHGDWEDDSADGSSSSGSLFLVHPRATVSSDASSKRSSGTYWANALALVNLEQQRGHSPGDEIAGLVCHTWGSADSDPGFTLRTGPEDTRVAIERSPSGRLSYEDVGTDPSGRILRVSA